MVISARASEEKTHWREGVRNRKFICRLRKFVCQCMEIENGSVGLAIFVVDTRPGADDAGRAANAADLDTLGTIQEAKGYNDSVSPRRRCCGKSTYIHCEYPSCIDAWTE